MNGKSVSLAICPRNISSSSAMSERRTGLYSRRSCKSISILCRILKAVWCEKLGVNINRKINSVKSGER
jgi:hypothetical protein